MLAWIIFNYTQNYYQVTYVLSRDKIIALSLCLFIPVILEVYSYWRIKNLKQKLLRQVFRFILNLSYLLILLKLSTLLREPIYHSLNLYIASYFTLHLALSLTNLSGLRINKHIAGISSLIVFSSQISIYFTTNRLGLISLLILLLGAYISYQLYQKKNIYKILLAILIGGLPVMLAFKLGLK